MHQCWPYVVTIVITAIHHQRLTFQPRQKVCGVCVYLHQRAPVIAITTLHDACHRSVFVGAELWQLASSITSQGVVSLPDAHGCGCFCFCCFCCCCCCCCSSVLMFFFRLILNVQ